MKSEITAAYAKAGASSIAGYAGWTIVNSAPYQAATHGNRYVNNYANGKAAARYKKFEKAGKMPAGAVIAKDSFTVSPKGGLGVGPMFVMEKMKKGFNRASGDWRYTMIMPNGSVFGATKGKNSVKMNFCHECHMAVDEDQDSLFFLPEDYRLKF